MNIYIYRVDFPNLFPSFPMCLKVVMNIYLQGRFSQFFSNVSQGHYDDLQGGFSLFSPNLCLKVTMRIKTYLSVYKMVDFPQYWICYSVKGPLIHLKCNVKLFCVAILSFVWTMFVVHYPDQYHLNHHDHLHHDHDRDGETCRRCRRVCAIFSLLLC